jgi:uncharacterized protein (DUF697 family)
MEVLIGFAIGYLVGTRQGQDGLRDVRESVDAIRNSSEVRQLVVGGASVAGSAVRQVLANGTGAALGGTVDVLVRRATDILNGTREQQAA